MKKFLLISFLLVVLVSSGIYLYSQKQKKKDTDQDVEFIKQAQSYLEDREFSKALEQYKLAINANPTNTDSYLSAADIYLQKFQKDEALDLLFNGESQVSEPDKIHYLIGKIFFDEGDTKNAIKNYEQAYKENASNYTNALALVIAYTYNPEELNKAKKVLSNIDTQEGEFYLKKLYYQALLSYDDIDSAIEYLETASSISDEEYKPILESFLESAKKIKKDEKNIVQNNTLLAFELLRAQFYNLAIPLLDEVVTKNDEYYAAFMYRGICYLKLNEMSDAQKDLEKAVEIDPKEIEPWLFLAQVFTAQNNQKQAVESFEEALNLDSQNENARYDLTKTYIHFGQYRQARLEYKKLIEMKSSDDLTYRTELAYIDLDYLEEYTEGLEIAKQTLEHYKKELQIQKETYSQLLDLLGWAYLKNNQKDKSLDTFEEAKTAYAYHASIYYHLGILYTEINRPIDAQIHFERAIDLDTEGSTGAKARNDLNDLLSKEKDENTN